MNQSTLGPEEWFWITRAQADTILSQNGHWPFEHVTVDELYALVDKLTIKKLVQSILRVIGSVTTGFGVIFTLLLIGTLWKKAVVEKNTFFSAMLMIATLDLVFNILDMIFNVCFRTWKVTGYSDYAAMWMVAYVRGLAFVASLASDVCALCITIERYLAIGKPQFYRNISPNVKRNVWRLVFVLVLLTSATRMHYTMAMQVEPVTTGGYVYTQSQLGATPFVVGLAMFSDAVLPVILVLFMSVLSTKFRMAVVKRQEAKKTKSKVHPESTNNKTQGVMVNKVQVLQVQEYSARTTAPTNGKLQTDATTAGNTKKETNDHSFGSIVVLTLALDALLMFDNLSYVLYFVAELLVARNRIGYDSTYDELSSYCFAQSFEGYAALTNVTIECMTRAINFPLYMALSGTMRREFRAFVKRLLRTLKI